MAALTDGVNIFAQTSPKTPAGASGSWDTKPETAVVGDTSVPNVGTNLPPALTGDTSNTNTTAPVGALSSVTGAVELTKAKQTADQLAGRAYNNGSGALTAPNGSAIAAPAGAQKSDNGLWYANGQAYSLAPNSDGSQDTTNGNDTSKDQNSVNFINKDTGQEYTLTNPSPGQIQNFKDNGWDITNGTGDGSGLISNARDPQVAKAEAQTGQAKSVLANATAKLTSFDTSNDPALTSLLNSITQQWNSRIGQMEQVNKGQVASTTTLGIRLGDRYTGGKGGMFGGIISAEEAAGVNRIADLESQKQQALAAAKQAYDTQKWNQYAKLVDVAQQAYENQAAALTKLQTDSTTQSKNIQEAIAKDREDYYTEVQKPIDDLIIVAKNNGAPPDLLKKAAAAESIGDAYTVLGDYSAGGTGIIGEYNYYKAQAKAAGQMPVDFNAYQSIDANRKAKAAASAAGGTGSIDLTTFDTVTQKKLDTSGFTKYNGGTQDLAVQLVTGGIAPSELSKRTTGSSSYNDVLTAANIYSKAVTGKPFSIAQADRDYKFAQRPQTQDTLNYLGSLVGSDDGNGNTSGGNLDELVTLSNGISRTRFPAINDIAGWTRYSTGDPKIAAFQATATEIADQVAKILQGGGSGTSDAKLQQAANLFNTGFTKDQMIATVNALKPLLANRAKNMIKDNPYLSDYAEQFGIPQNVPGAAPTTADVLIKQQETDPLGLGSATPANNNPLGI